MNKVVSEKKSKFIETKLITMVFSLLFVVSLFMCINTFAGSKPFSLKLVTILDKSEGVTGNISSFNDDEIINDITFHKLNDSVTFKLGIKSNITNKVTILSITDNNDSDYVYYEYDKHENEKLESGSTLYLSIKSIYRNEITDITKRNQTNSVKFTIKYLENGKQKESNILINPKTKDTIYISYILLIISLTGLVISVILDNTRKNYNLSILIIGLILSPMIVKAEMFVYNVTFKTSIGLYDKQVITYVIDDVEHTLINQYGVPVTGLDTPEKEGFLFKKWTYEDGSDFELTEPITNDIKIIANFEKLTSRVDFDANEGVFDTEISANTIEYYNDKYYFDTMYKEPKRTGYRFTGWNTKKDGTGTTYTNEQAVLNGISSLNMKTLYAQWVKLEATFMTGETFNQRIKRLAGDETIVEVKRTYDKPDSSNMTDNNIVSYYRSAEPIYAWFDNGTIYYWTEDIDPALNANSSRMFQQLREVKTIDLETLDTSKVTDMSNMFYYDTKLESLDLSNFNTSKVTSMGSMFSGCKSLKTLDLSDFDTKNVVNMSHMFGAAEMNYMAFTEIKGLDTFDTSKVTDMSGMFYYCGNLKSLDLRNFNTENVTNMNSMFRGCNSLETLNVTSFNTSKITNMNRMFQECRSLTSIDLSSFDTSNVLNTEYMFSTCPNLKVLNISDFDLRKVTNANGMLPDYVEEVTATNIKLNNSSKGIFSGKPKLVYLDISNADVSIVTNMSHMFSGCQSLKTLDLSSFVTNQVTDMNYMFNTCLNLESINLSSFNTSNVTNLSNMFYYCKKLANINLSNFVTNNVTNMSGMFFECNSLTTLDVSNFVTNSVTDMSSMFNGCKKLTSLNVSDFVTDNVINMSSMFANCSSLLTLNVDNFVTNNVTNMANMFGGCRGLTTLNLSNFVTDNVTNMGSMFSSCSGLTSLSLTNFNTSNVTNMGSMFSRCSGLTSVDLSSFNTSSVTDMSWMFYQCVKLPSINLSNFDTSNVTNIGEMFRQCSSLVELDLSSFNINKVTRITEMFYNDTNLTTIYVTPSYFDATNVSDSSIMFAYCYKLKGGHGTTYSVTNSAYARVDDPENGKPGYFTDIADKPVEP